MIFHFIHKWKTIFNDYYVVYSECETCLKRKYSIKKMVYSECVDENWVNKKTDLLMHLNFYLKQKLRVWQENNLHILG